MSEILNVGAHLITRRTGYIHHGLYAGCGMVIHYSGLSAGLNAGPVEEITLEQFAGKRGYSIIKNETATHSGPSAIQRARSRLGEDQYNVLTNNCEHFVRWCLNGQHESKQVKHAIKAAAGLIASRYGSNLVGAALSPAGMTLATGVAVGYGLHRYVIKRQALATQPTEPKTEEHSTP